MTQRGLSRRATRTHREDDVFVLIILVLPATVRPIEHQSLWAVRLLMVCCISVVRVVRGLQRVCFGGDSRTSRVVDLVIADTEQFP